MSSSITSDEIVVAPIAVQNWTVRSFMADNYYDTLKRLVSIGFSAVELAGWGNASTPNEFKQACDELGLKIVGLHQPPLEKRGLEELTEEISENLQIMGCRTATVSSPNEMDLTVTEFNKYADLCIQVADSLADKGLELEFHAFHRDLKTIPNSTTTGLDLLLAKTEGSNVKFELDTFFIKLAGLEIEEVASKVGKRCGMIHLNDISGSNQCALGQGTIEWEAVLPIIQKKCQPSVFIVEHKTDLPFEWLSQSLEFLGKLPNFKIENGDLQ